MMRPMGFQKVTLVRRTFRPPARRRWLPLIVGLALALTIGPVLADTVSINFETFTPGNVNGQDGWGFTGPYDVAVTDNVADGYTGPTYAGFGNRSLRISNASTSGSFGDWAFSKSLTDEAGEPAAANGGMSGGTRQPYFSAAFDIASTVPGAEQPGLQFSLAPDRGDGARMSFLRVNDTPTGLQVVFSEYQTAGGPGCTGSFPLTMVATGLSRTVPHRLQLTMQFVPGSDNDIVNVYVDGVLKHTAGSWEDYFVECEGNPTRTVDSLIFQARSGSGTAPATLGKGFLIDNIVLLSGPVPPQCTITCYADVNAGNDANDGITPGTAKKTIQAAVNQVSVGGTVIAAVGSYPENVTINKRLTLDGAGSGPADTVVSGSIALTSGGASAVNRLTVKDLRVTGSAGDGISLQSAVNFTTLDNVAAVSNAGAGIGIAAGASVLDLKVDDVRLEANANTGFNIASTVTSANTIEIKNGVIFNNGLNGFMSGGNGSPNVNNVTIDGTAFTGNGATPGVGGEGDISLFGFNGNATIKNVAINADSRIALQIRGKGIGSLAFLGPVAPSGTIQIDNVTIQGTTSFSAFSLQHYTDVSGISLSNVTLSTTSPFGLYLETLGTTLDLNDTQFNGTHGAQRTIANVSLGAVDATGTSFAGVPALTATLAQLYAIEDKIGHSIDFAPGGFVTVRANNAYVTPNSFIAPLTTAPSVQRGVDAAGAGDTVNVQAGTYTEQVVITKDLTVVGTDGALLTNIVAPATIPVAANPASAIVRIDGAGVGVDLSGFTVKGPGPGSCGSIGAGIFVSGGANGVIHDNRVLDIRDHEPVPPPNLSGCQNGVGILVGRSAFATTGTATITDNHIEGYQKNGIVVSNTGSSATIKDNTVKGFGAQTQIAQNGVQISSGATGSIENNTIQDHLCNAPSCGPNPVTDTQSAGVILYDHGAGVLVKGNTITNNDMGLYTYMLVPGVTTVDSNQITANRYSGVFADQGIVNVFSNNIQGPGDIGVVIVAFGGVARNSTAVVLFNFINNVGDGIKLIDDDTSDAFIPTVTANLNHLASNTTGINNTTSGGINGESNWWGSATGPGPVGPGTGVPVSTNVDFQPWLCDGTDTQPSVTGFQPNLTLCPPPTVAGVKFNDPNRSLLQEPGDVGIAGVTIFVDTNGNGLLDGGELSTVTDGAGAYALAAPPGAQRICEVLPSGRVHTTPRCQTVTSVLNQTAIANFGNMPVLGWCPNGMVTNSIVGIALTSNLSSFYRPVHLTRAGTGGPWPGTRVLVQGGNAGNPVTYVWRSELVANALLLSNFNAVANPKLVLKYNYQQTRQQVDGLPLTSNTSIFATGSVVSSQGAWARYIGRGSALPAIAPTDFAVFDKNGELHIYNPPVLGGGYEDVWVITKPLANGSGFITTKGEVAGKIVNNRLVSVSGTCGDKAESAIVTSGETGVIDTPLPGTGPAVPINDVPPDPIDVINRPNPF
ncbi:MAG: right-handed parallel beta-helix repeat-containing protein [Chloroflexi bacterium]|nr:right-handed parallel beta-helix repeat-containing protein [Chloroflexota bacterium]